MGASERDSSYALNSLHTSEQLVAPVDTEVERFLVAKFLWVSLKDPLGGHVLDTFVNLPEEDFNTVYNNGFRPNDMQYLSSIGQETRWNTPIPDTFSLVVPDQAFPTKPDGHGAVTLSLGSLCDQVATHLGSFPSHNQEDFYEGENKITTLISSRLKMLAEVTMNTPVTMAIKSSHDDPSLFSISKLSAFNQHSTADSK